MDVHCFPVLAFSLIEPSQLLHVLSVTHRFLWTTNLRQQEERLTPEHELFIFLQERIQRLSTIQQLIYYVFYVVWVQLIVFVNVLNHLLVLFLIKHI